MVWVYGHLLQFSVQQCRVCARCCDPVGCFRATFRASKIARQFIFQGAFNAPLTLPKIRSHLVKEQRSKLKMGRHLWALMGPKYPRPNTLWSNNFPCL